MSARGFVLGMNETPKLNAERGAAVRVRCSDVRPTRHKDPKDGTLNIGDAVGPGGGGAARITAHQPTLLELYRQDPVALCEQITRRVHRARNDDIRAFFARLFC
jgi:hypothetical protein